MYTLEFRWTVSRGRATYGYNVCTLYVDGKKAAACNGGGYDMKGTNLGHWIAKQFADRLLKLKSEDMPEQSRWQRAEHPRRICRECVQKTLEPDSVPWLASDVLVCPTCGAQTDIDWHDGQTIKEGRYFYGLSYHDPTYDPGKAIVGKDCTDRTLGKDGTGKTVEQAEADGDSLGLERYQAFYTASSKHPSKHCTVPLIDGACGWLSVEAIGKAIGLSFRWVKTRSKNIDLWQVEVAE